MRHDHTIGLDVQSRLMRRDRSPLDERIHLGLFLFDHHLGTRAENLKSNDPAYQNDNRQNDPQDEVTEKFHRRETTFKRLRLKLG